MLQRPACVPKVPPPTSLPRPPEPATFCRSAHSREQEQWEETLAGGGWGNFCNESATYLTFVDDRREGRMHAHHRHCWEFAAGVEVFLPDDRCAILCGVTTKRPKIMNSCWSKAFESHRRTTSDLHVFLLLCKNRNALNQFFVFRRDESVHKFTLKRHQLRMPRRIIRQDSIRASYLRKHAEPKQLPSKEKTKTNRRSPGLFFFNFKQFFTLSVQTLCRYCTSTSGWDWDHFNVSEFVNFSIHDKMEKYNFNWCNVQTGGAALCSDSELLKLGKSQSAALICKVFSLWKKRKENKRRERKPAGGHNRVSCVIFLTKWLRWCHFDGFSGFGVLLWIVKQYHAAARYIKVSALDSRCRLACFVEIMPLR